MLSSAERAELEAMLAGMRRRVAIAAALVAFAVIRIATVGFPVWVPVAVAAGSAALVVVLIGRYRSVVGQARERGY